LRRISLEEKERMAFGSGNFQPIHTEPAVPFDCLPGTEFTSGNFTHMVVAQSPQYLAAAADQLPGVCREYFEPV